MRAKARSTPTQDLAAVPGRQRHATGCDRVADLGPGSRLPVLAKEAPDGADELVGLGQDAQVTAWIDVRLCIGDQARLKAGAAGRDDRIVVTADDPVSAELGD